MSIPWRQPVARLLRQIANKLDPPKPQTFIYVLDPEYVRDMVAHIAAQN